MLYSSLLACWSDPLIRALLLWLLVTGFIGFFAMLIDKGRAIYGEWRISERTLIILSAMGGFWGVILASELVHHKNSKLEFILPVFGVAVAWAFMILRFRILNQCLGAQ